MSAPESDWQRLWFATRHKAWSSLAIIPSDPGVEAGSVAESLVATGRVHGERPVTLLNARGVTLSGVHQLIDAMGTMTGRGDWVIVPVDPIGENPSAVPIVQAAPFPPPVRQARGFCRTCLSQSGMRTPVDGWSQRIPGSRPCS